MITRYLTDLKEAIRPEQLDMLQKVFDKACYSSHHQERTSGRRFGSNAFPSLQKPH